MRDGSAVAVLGFRPHTYWTVAVALAGEPDGPQVIERRKIVFAAGGERFVYHQVAEMAASAAAARIAKVRSATVASAAHGIAELTAAVGEAGFTVGLAVVPTGRARTAPTKMMGHVLGPPWSEDQRLATLAAWVGIADLLA